MPTFHFLVGTFNTPHLYTLAFDVPSPKVNGVSGSTSCFNGVFERNSLTNGNHDATRANHESTSLTNGNRCAKATLSILHRSPAIGPHSWLHLQPRPDGKGQNLYATAWTEPPSLCSYAVDSPHSIRHLNSVGIASRSGYVCASPSHVYSAGGASGEVFTIDQSTGGFATLPNSKSTSQGVIHQEPHQRLSFVEKSSVQQDDGSVMDFGGLRHGAHSADLSPDGSLLYVADIGRNAIFTFAVDQDFGKVTLAEKYSSPRATDGPRHVWPHPAGKVVYCLQEHTSMVDVFRVSGKGTETRLRHVQGVRCIPDGEREGDYWADEVRTSLSTGKQPKWLYASARGLEEGTKGWVFVYALNEIGEVDTSFGKKGCVCMWQTPTSGGWANAIQPGPTIEGMEYIALTDSADCSVMVLGWDGQEMKEVARTSLDDGAGAATAVWLD